MKTVKMHKNSVVNSEQRGVESDGVHNGRRFDINLATWHKLMLTMDELKSSRSINPIAKNGND